MSNFVVQVYKNSNSNKAPNIHLPCGLPQVDLANPQLIQTAKELFQSSGILTIRDLFPRDLITSLYRAFLKSYQPYFLDKEYANVLDVGNKRKMLTVEVQDEFNSPELYGNPFLLNLMPELLGSEFVMGSFGAVIALPGAKEQHIHRDHPPLFDDENLDLALPSFAVTVVVPLVNLTPETGSTQVWKGSHKASYSQEYSGKDAFVPFMETGSCYLMDYQLLHGGTANISQIVRPILYLIYYRSWFRESVNYDKQVRLSLSQPEYDKVPEEYKFLFSRVREISTSGPSSQFPTEQVSTRQVSTRQVSTRQVSTGQVSTGQVSTRQAKATRDFKQLTASQQVYILKELADNVLTQYGLENSNVELISHGDNTVFAIAISEGNLLPEFQNIDHQTNHFYVRDRFILRIHRSHYLSPLTIESELTWLQQLSVNLDFPVPAPIPTLDGNLLAKIDNSALDESRVCSLTRWIKGRSLSKKFRSDLLTVEDIKQIGRLMGTLHRYATQQTFPAEFTRPHWNWDGLFGSSAGYSNDGDRVWSLVPQSYQRLFQTISQEVHHVMEELGEAPDQFGLIHGDFWIGNLLQDGQTIGPIDFADCGFSYWGYEVARFFSDFLSNQDFSLYFDHFLAGYNQTHSFPEKQLPHLQLFVAAQQVSFALWRINRAQDHPQFRVAVDDDLQETVAIIEAILGN